MVTDNVLKSVRYIETDPIIVASFGLVICNWLVTALPEDRSENATLFPGDTKSMSGFPPSVYASLFAASILASVSAALVPARSLIFEPSPVGVVDAEMTLMLVI